MSAIGLPNFSARAFNTGTSTAAQRLQELLATVLTEYRRLTTRESTLANLARVYAECREPGWDGYEAEPVSAEAYHFAARFIMALPAVFPAPDVTADPDGEISLEWDCGRWKALSLSVGPGGKITWAALLNRQKRETGTEIFDDFVSPEVLAVIWKVTRA